MNIFLLDWDHERNAHYHVDRHVVKMILEYAQLLSTAHRVLDGVRQVIRTEKGRRKTIYRLAGESNNHFYSATHTNHPSAVWVRMSHTNYRYLHNLLVELCKEYTFRYGKVHKVQNSGLLYSLAEPPEKIRKYIMTPFSLAMPDEYKVNDPVESYRNYYRNAKTSLHSWKGRETPNWI